LIDWRFIVAKHIINRKWENGFIVTFDTIFDHTEDFGRDTILADGELFIDAGAHCGFWTLQASKYYKTVMAIEPTKTTLKSLKANLKSNRIGNVQVIEAALSDKVGFAQFYHWQEGAMGNSLYSEPVTYTADYGFAVKPETVRTISIDSLEVTPTVIKLDVEGAEYDAVQGAKRTIEESHPKLFIEIHHPENEKRIIQALPGYEWKRHSRTMLSKGNMEFDQIHLKGVFKE